MCGRTVRFCGVAGTAFLVMGAAAAEAVGQAPQVSVELRGGVTMPAGEFDAARNAPGAQSSAAFRGLLSTQLGRHIAPFAGWSRSVFACAPACRDQGDIVVSGPTAGIRLLVPVEAAGAAAFGEVSGGYASTRITGPGETLSRELGWEAGFGFEWSVLERGGIGVAYMHGRLPTEVRFGQPGKMQRTSDVRYGRFEIGARYRVL